MHHAFIFCIAVVLSLPKGISISPLTKSNTQNPRIHIFIINHNNITHIQPSSCILFGSREEWGWNKARQLVRALSLVNQWSKNNTSIVRRTNTTRNTKKSSITAKQFPTLSSMFDTATPSKPSSLNFSSLSSSHAEKKAETEAEKYEAATFAYLYLCEQDMHVPNTKNLERANAVGQDWTVSE